MPEPLRVNDATVDHIEDGIYRIRIMTPDAPISFNQFLIDDEQPALLHTGMFPMYDQVRASVAEVLDPSSIRYVCIGHFEADEDLGDEMCAMYRDIGIFAREDPVLDVVDRVEEYGPRLVHPMHGASFRGESLPSYIDALRSQPFAFEGKVFGEPVPHAH
jgi:hypothetical protein